jgi:HEAT repeat protein
MMVRNSRTGLVAVWFFWLMFAARPAHAWDEAIDSVMYRSPDLPKARMAIVFPEQIKAPWLEALRRPEADYLCPAALTLAFAHRRGMKGLEAAVPALLEALDRPNQHPSVRLTIARTLIELDAREAADSLFRQAQSGDRGLRSEIEPALTRWDFAPARDVWLERLGQPDPSGDGLVLAARALGALGEKRAVPGLLDLVLSSRMAAPVRLEAAKALGVLRVSGLETDAKRLIADQTPRGMVARLAAASLLRHHQGEEAVRLLLGLARDAEPAVAAVALARLVELDPKLVVSDLAHFLANPDAKVRSFAVEVLFREPSVKHVGLLAERLNDPHPEVRVKARKSMHRLAATPDFQKAVIGQATRILAGSDWRGLDQAAILLGQLQHKPAARRLVELLTFDRPEVRVSAAWALRRVAVPETLPAALEHFRLAGGRGTRVPQIGGGGGGPPAPPGGGQARAPIGIGHAGPAFIMPPEALDQQLCQLAQFFGESRYRPADAALRQQIPRVGVALMPIETRAAAIWALGLIHEGKPVAEIDQALAGRLSDGGAPFRPPEHPHVRSMSAVTLGRMKAREMLPTLRSFYIVRKPSLDPVNNACGWAIEQLTGEIMPPAGTVEVPAESFKNWLQAFEPRP